ncbi:MAG: hypothetical protein R3F11_16195 [Verrucomicrobiales bacterium]
MLASPDAFANHIPESNAVLWHTLVIDPGNEDTLYFTAPTPYPTNDLCTFPSLADHARGLVGET